MRVVHDQPAPRRITVSAELYARLAVVANAGDLARSIDSIVEDVLVRALAQADLWRALVVDLGLDQQEVP